MVACVPISQEKIRAEVWMGTTLIAKTPFVKSFNVGQSRDQISTTFSVSFEIVAGLSFPIGENIIIKAGTKDNIRTIFTGIIESTTAQPAFGKPSYFSLTLAGRGKLSVLENKKFSRRLKTDGQGLFCLITGGSKNRPQAYYSLDRPTTSANKQVISSSPNPASMGGENSPFVRYNDSSSNQSTGGLPSQLAGKPSGAEGGTGGTGLGIHTHENLEQGGPAFAVYSAD